MIELRTLLIAVGFLPLLLATSNSAVAHGSVTPDEDICIIQIGYYRAHFKIYLPEERGHKEYCEDIPQTGSATFVMQYEHSGLGSVPIDFRVIKNVTGKGVFTILEDVQKIDRIEDVTLFHQPAIIQPDVFTYLHPFDEQGEFVGIVTVQQPDTGVIYTAVFPFEVGFAGIPIWVWFILGAIFLQLNFLWMNGTLARWQENRKRPLEVGDAHA